MADHAFGLGHRKGYRRVFVLVLAAILAALLFLKDWSYQPLPSASLQGPSKQAFVVASLKADDTSWIHENLPDWHLFRYVVDDENAEFTVPQNKGREAMVYLTYV